MMGAIRVKLEPVGQAPQTYVWLLPDRKEEEKLEKKIRREIKIKEEEEEIISSWGESPSYSPLYVWRRSAAPSPASPWLTPHVKRRLQFSASPSPPP
tara:strand:+ start:8089 stop:8379 length:291 start_codon:yes stop_codon:yes gene_type:complete